MTTARPRERKRDELHLDAAISADVELFAAHSSRVHCYRNPKMKFCVNVRFSTKYRSPALGRQTSGHKKHRAHINTET